MFRRLWSRTQKSLSSRLIFSHVAVTIMVLAIALGISNITFRNYLVGSQIKSLAQQGQTLSRVMQGYFSGTLYGPEAAYLIHVVQGTLNDRVYVLDNTGQILLETGNNQLPQAPWSQNVLAHVLINGQEFQGILEGGNRRPEATAGIPVIVHGQVVGGVFLEAPLSNSNKTAASLTGLLLVGELASIVMAGILAYGFSKRLTSPLIALRQTVSQMGRGNDQEEMHAKIEGPQEVRDLAQEFNRMSDRIHLQMMQLRKEAEVRDTLLAHVAHDLRTPLTSIRGFLEAIRDHMVEGPGLDRAVEVAWEETLRLKRLVDRLLAATRIQSGIGNKSPVHVSTWIETTLERVTPLAQETHHPLIWRRRDDAVILAVEDYLVEALINVIDNAAKWGPADTPIIIDTVRDQEEQTIHVSVKDQGPGIPEEMLDHVFERFVTGDKARRGSSGLGLSIVYEVMQQHGGRVRALNDAEGGALIIMTLPVLPERG
ncbi:MAG: sensor histidine kinase [Sulfobacillus thermosulfidooxidans]|uniref:histidine kinase n=1 Tax=Sulfobacillus thermosulfidooxidans TaxID=28034 RepID=A0A2T2WQG1_SULTH|nr:MAG: sensor histidine kinase [Sulfobacillus thermosulfidooxidans]